MLTNNLYDILSKGVFVGILKATATSVTVKGDWIIPFKWCCDSVSNSIKILNVLYRRRNVDNKLIFIS